MDSPPPELPGLGGPLAVSFLSLGLVCLLAYVILRWLSRRGLGQGTGPVRVLARCPLEPRRSVFLVEAAGRCFLIGAGDNAMTLLAEVDPSEVSLPERLPGGGAGGRFAAALARVIGRSRETGLKG